MLELQLAYIREYVPAPEQPGLSVPQGPLRGQLIKVEEGH
jgi:hypothetical protein